MSTDIVHVRHRRRYGPALAPVARFYRKVQERFRRCPDMEVQQNMVRTVNLLLFLTYGIGYALTFQVYIPAYFSVLGFWLLCTLGIYVWIYIAPDKSTPRRIFHLFGDQAVIAWAMLTYGQWTSPAYAMYLLVTIGYGIRFGRRYLYLTTACSVVGFGSVILFSDYWRALVPLNLALWLVILVFPYYFSVFYKRLADANNRLHDLATRDTLTGLPNRPFLYERLKEAIAAAERHKRRFAVLFVDIDNFKRINDTHGHEAGDAALRATARILRDSVRKADIVARLGGDEFVILLNETRGTNAQIAENLRDALAAYTPHVSASIGIATYPDCGTDAETLVRHADHAMYEAKRAGKNRWSVCPDAYGYVRSVDSLRGGVEH